MMQTLFLLAIVGVISYSVGCRLRHTDKSTGATIKWQHGLLNAGALFALVVPGEWSGVVLGAGVVAFLVLGSRRWRHGVPGSLPRG